MEKKKKQAIMECDNYDELLNIEYGPIGTPSREEFDVQSETFILSECLKEQRKEAGLTQQQLADRIGTKKSYISKIENGHTDIQLSTLFRIFNGLGKKITFNIL